MPCFNHSVNIPQYLQPIHNHFTCFRNGSETGLHNEMIYGLVAPGYEDAKSIK